MRIFYVLILSATLSACDRGSDSTDAKGDSKALRQSSSEQATDQSADLHRVQPGQKPEDYRSKEMKEFLNSAAPQWLTLGSAIRPDEVETPPNPEKVQSKGLTPKGSSKEVVIDGETIEFPFLASEMTWVAVSPSRSRVVLERGEIGEVRAVEQDGTVSGSGDPLPTLNFESDRRWMLTRWRWISESELVTSLNRPTAVGDIIAESKLYYYNIITKNLREIDLPDKFINQNDPYLEVLGNAGREVHISTLTGEAWFRIPQSP